MRTSTHFHNEFSKPALRDQLRLWTVGWLLVKPPGSAHGSDYGSAPGSAPGRIPDSVPGSPPVVPTDNRAPLGTHIN